MTSAPAFAARVDVASVEPSSTTMTCGSCRRTASTTEKMAAASFRQGMTTTHSAGHCMPKSYATAGGCPAISPFLWPQRWHGVFPSLLEFMVCAPAAISFNLASDLRLVDAHRRSAQITWAGTGSAARARRKHRFQPVWPPGFSPRRWWKSPTFAARTASIAACAATIAG